jgi:hypothetical protein
MDLDSIPPPQLPPPPPARRRSRPATRSRIVAGVLSVAAFLGLGAGMAIGSGGGGTGADTASSAADGSTQIGTPTDGGAFVPWPGAVPSAPSLGGTPSTSTHGS